MSSCDCFKVSFTSKVFQLVVLILHVATLICITEASFYLLVELLLLMPRAAKTFLNLLPLFAVVVSFFFFASVVLLTFATAAHVSCSLSILVLSITPELVA